MADELLLEPAIRRVFVGKKRTRQAAGKQSFSAAGSGAPLGEPTHDGHE
jgi:hypothetical protein